MVGNRTMLRVEPALIEFISIHKTARYPIEKMIVAHNHWVPPMNPTSETQIFSRVPTCQLPPFRFSIIPR